MECAGGAAGSSGSGKLVDVTITLGVIDGAGDALLELLKHSAQPSTGCPAQASESVMTVSCGAKSPQPSGQQTTSPSAEATKNTSAIRDADRDTTC